MASSQPMREPTFLVLAALARHPGHGYRLGKDIEELSEGRVKLRAGTLYAVLDRLHRDGLVIQGDPEPGDGPPRRTYAITAEGRVALEHEVRRLQASAAIGELGLGWSG
ncbi:MAG: PadR family transcriptional regulator [Acidimicrobiales bacterium]